MKNKGHHFNFFKSSYQFSDSISPFNTNSKVEKTSLDLITVIFPPRGEGVFFPMILPSMLKFLYCQQLLKIQKLLHSFIFRSFTHWFCKIIAMCLFNFFATLSTSFTCSILIKMFIDNNYKVLIMCKVHYFHWIYCLNMEG